MSRSLTIALVLVGALICGIALWSTAPPVSARAAVRPTPVVLPIEPNGEEVLARALLVLLPPGLRQQAVIGEQPAAEHMLARDVGPGVIARGRGVSWRQLDPAQRALLWRLVEQAAARCRAADIALALQQAERGRAELSFAWAGGSALGGPCYVRVHGEHFAVEWLRSPAGFEHAAWRDFAADGARPWLGERVAAELRPR